MIEDSDESDIMVSNPLLTAVYEGVAGYFCSVGAGLAYLAVGAAPQQPL
jgi:hypothetical protein